MAVHTPTVDSGKPFYDIDQHWFGCPSPAARRELDGGLLSGWLCENCGGDTVAGRFCTPCEAMIAEDMGLALVTVPSLAACRGGVQL